MATVAVQPQPNDVLIGRSKKNQEHPGNRQLDGMIQRRYREYDEAPRKTDYLDKDTMVSKTEINVEIVRAIQSMGGRFLSKNRSGEWVICTDEKARKTIGHWFRKKIQVAAEETSMSQEANASVLSLHSSEIDNYLKDALSSSQDASKPPATSKSASVPVASEFASEFASSVGSGRLSSVDSLHSSEIDRYMKDATDLSHDSSKPKAVKGESTKLPVLGTATGSVMSLDTHNPKSGSSVDSTLLEAAAALSGMEISGSSTKSPARLLSVSQITSSAGGSFPVDLRDRLESPGEDITPSMFDTNTQSMDETLSIATAQARENRDIGSILREMELHPSDSSFQVRCLGRIAELLWENGSLEPLQVEAEKVVLALCGTMASFDSHVDVQRSGCLALGHLTGRGIFIKARVGTVFRAMGRFPTDETLQDYACKVLCDSTKLGTAWVGTHYNFGDELNQLPAQVLIQAMRRFPGNQRISDRGCQALERMVLDHKRRVKRLLVEEEGPLSLLAAADLLVVSQAMNKFKRNENIQKCGSSALLHSVLLDPSLDAELYVSTILSAVKHHKECIELAKIGFDFFEILGSRPSVEAIIEMIDLGLSARSCHHGITVLCRLVPNHRESILNRSGAEAIVRAMRRHLLDLRIQDSGCEALSVLLQESGEWPTRNTSVLSEATQVVCDASVRHRSFYWVCKALRQLAEHTQELENILKFVFDTLLAGTTAAPPVPVVLLLGSLTEHRMWPELARPYRSALAQIVRSAERRPFSDYWDDRATEYFRSLYRLDSDLAIAGMLFDLASILMKDDIGDWDSGLLYAICPLLTEVVEHSNGCQNCPFAPFGRDTLRKILARVEKIKQSPPPQVLGFKPGVCSIKCGEMHLEAFKALDALDRIDNNR